MSKLQNLLNELLALGALDRAKNSARYFKTGPGQYGEGDIFIGVTVPELRKTIKRYRDLSLEDTVALLHSPEHELRLAALLILNGQFAKADDARRQLIYDLYLKHTAFINNWDLVDLSAPKIVGEYLQGRNTAILTNLAKSKLIWERRIAILATFAFIKRRQSAEAFMIAEMLINDSHDLIHKAVGWMLREVGKNCGQDAEEEFLLKHYKTMPRTALRYAIERFPEERRQAYLQGLA